MERHIGLFAQERNNEKEISELILNGNQIEFYKRGTSVVFPSVFIGHDAGHEYKVVTKGSANCGKFNTLERAISYKVSYVLQQNAPFNFDMSIEGITAVSFYFPELIDWIDINTVKIGANNDNQLIAVEVNTQNINLKNENPKIDVYFEPKNPIVGIEDDARTTLLLKKVPRIRISYQNPANYLRLYNDIKTIMQFFALLIGSVSDVQDIRLEIVDQKFHSLLYINKDFSYNLRNRPFPDYSRTKLQTISKRVNEYFENWYDFCLYEKFNFIRLMYFESNSRRDVFVEDIFTIYVRILEGYHQRITDEKKVDEKKTADDLKKDIKKMINTEEGKALFEPIFAKTGWKFNSSHAGDVASWIVSGFLERINLESRLRKLDEQCFNIIAVNAGDIGVANYYQRIVSTRNYYSHYRSDQRNVFDYSAMCNAINVLKAMIIMLFFTHMKISKEVICSIMMNDTELLFNTKYLQKRVEPKIIQ